MSVAFEKLYIVFYYSSLIRRLTLLWTNGRRRVNSLHTEFSRSSGVLDFWESINLWVS